MGIIYDGFSDNVKDTAKGAVKVFQEPDLWELHVWGSDISDWQHLTAHWQQGVAQIAREPQACARYHAGRLLDCYYCSPEECIFGQYCYHYVNLQHPEVKISHLE